MKKYFFCTLLLLACTYSFSAEYRISDIEYIVTSGNTIARLIERNVDIDKNRIFKTEKDLVDYIRDYEVRLLNTRHFQTVKVDFTVDTPDGSGISPVHVIAEVEDSSHLLIMPYPKYDSNSGFELKLKGRDSNFLGTLNTASMSVIYALSQSSEKELPKNKYGLEFSYSYPFQLLSMNSSWNNDASITYFDGDEFPEWSISTGFSFSKKLADRVSLNFGVSEASRSELDYIKYDDQYYFTTSANMSLPITLVKTDKFGNLTYSPGTSVSYNYDIDGINPLNSGLLGPSITASHSISMGRVDWNDYNFRTGLSFSASQSVGHNFAGAQGNLTHSISTEIKAYKGFVYAGFLTDIYAFYNFFGNTSGFGSRLRGIRDDQNFSNKNSSATSSQTGIVMNFDMPLNFLSTDFSAVRNWLIANLWVPVFHTSENPGINKFMKLFDIDFQLSPFIDIALFHNAATQTYFSLKDGFYAAGAEVIMFPRFWRSIQFRASVGIDAGRTLGKFINMEWRNENISKYEISIGVGLHY